MTLSVVIPTWSGTTSDVDQIWTPPWKGTTGLADMAFKLCERVRPECDELIITEDADVYDERLHMISDIYMMHPNLGFTANVNLGLKAAHGDYIGVINSDVHDIEGNIRDLCVPGRVTSPTIRQMEYVPYFMAAFCVIPRTILEDSQYGYFGTGRDYHSDSTYGRLTKPVFQHVPSVKVSHFGGQSFAVKNRRPRQQRYVE
jgi:glycosyltransferase involved in cell wall biosynthesis